MKFPRLLLCLVFPVLFAGCAMLKPGPAKDTTQASEPIHPESKSTGSQTSGTAAKNVGETPVVVHLPSTYAAAIIPLDSATPSGSVRRHGRLYVLGNRIVGEHGRPVSLAGNSFSWSQWQSPFYNAEVVNWLKLDWKASIIRIAMGVEGGGYLEHPQEEMARVCTLVDAAIAADLYVIIDWHDHHAHQHTAQAIAFFQVMARKYGQYPNVLYEIFNEPEGEVSWAKDVKPYAEQVIAAIRAIDPENMIIVGTPHWSQDVDVAAEDPLKAKNIAYALHFYAGTHKQWLRDKALIALQKGLPLFVSEWGTCNADGNGPVDEVSTREWMDFMQQWGLSHCNWAVSDKDETASIVKPGSIVFGHWVDDDLTPSGRLVREWVRSWAAAADAR